MLTCEHCRNILLDSVYGLLEENELQEMREHLNTCSSCQATLEIVKTQRNLLARAARAITEVPEFSLASEDCATASQESSITTPPLGIATAQIQPYPGNENPVATSLPKRAMWRRPWVAWATAAAILLAVGTSISLYRHTVQNLQHELTTLRQEQTKVDQQFAAVPAKYQALQHAAIENLRAKTTPNLHVVGPTHLQPDAKATLHITTRRIEGELTSAKINIKLVEAGTDRVVQQTRVASAGQTHVELDAAQAKPGSKLNLIVEAETERGQASLRETIQAPAPSYVARIDTNKMAYPIRDVLFFRVLVLDRYSLKPPTQPVMLHVKLLNPKDEIVRQWLLPTGDGGILAGEWAIEEHFLAGSYVMQVGPVDGAAVPVQMASQRLEVVRDMRVPDIQFDQQQYLPGDVLSGVLPGGGVGGGSPTPEKAIGTIGNQTVPITIRQEPRALAARSALAGNPQQNKQDAKKSLDEANTQGLRRFETRVPEKLPPDAKNLDIRIQLQGGKQKEEYRGLVPLSPTDYAIDFFPEGGDLIAGVANRVFYRVRTKTGEAATGAGRVILMSSKNEIVDSPYQYGLGYLDFTPHAKETYTVRITSQVKTNEVVAKLGIRTSGVVLHVPDAVGKQGEPVRLTLRNQGPARRLMLVAQCRGQIVDQRWIDIKTGSQDCTLQTSEARGMIRVTAYEVEGAALEPVAERLVYRAATERLHVGMVLNTQQHQPGRHIQGQINARNEKGEPANGWMLASVVDERFQARPRSLSAHFLLLNEIRAGADLEDAPLILHDSAESIQMLERFLGTHGWRRFVRTREPVALAQAGPGPNTAALMIFSRENMPLETMQKQYDEQLARALMPLRHSAIKEEIELEDQRLRSAEAVYLASINLRNFEEWAQLGIRLYLGLFVAIMLGIGLIMMAIGAYRIVRGHKTPTPAFGGAFACLAVCLIMILLGHSAGPIDLPNPTLPARHAPLTQENQERLNKLLAQAPTLQHKEALPPAGTFAMNAPRSAREEQRDGQRSVEAEMKKAERGSSVAALARHDQLARSFADRDRAGEGNAVLTEQNRSRENKMLLDRFKDARQQQPLPGYGGAGKSPGTAQPTSPPKASQVSPNPTAKGKEATTAIPQSPAEKGKADHQDRKLAEFARNREYAHQYAPNLVSDTLLWSPTLNLTNGTAEVRFDIASGQATYRVLLLGHTSTGRFGFYETRLDVPAVGR